MKLAAFAAVAALTTAAPAFAQTAASAPAPVAGEAATAAKYSLDTPVETIAADPAALKVLNADLPGLTTHAMYDSFKGMTLNQLQPMSGGAISVEALAKTAADLAAIK